MFLEVNQPAYRPASLLADQQGCRRNPVANLQESLLDNPRGDLPNDPQENLVYVQVVNQLCYQPIGHQSALQSSPQRYLQDNLLESLPLLRDSRQGIHLENQQEFLLDNHLLNRLVFQVGSQVGNHPVDLQLLQASLLGALHIQVDSPLGSLRFDPQNTHLQDLHILLGNPQANLQDNHHGIQAITPVDNLQECTSIK